MTHPIDTSPEAIAALLARYTKAFGLASEAYDKGYRNAVKEMAAEIARLTAALEAAQAEVKRLTRDLTEDRFTIVMNGKVSDEFKARAEKAEAERDEARAQVAHWQRQSAENWAAFSAMREHINEHLPMRSAEADLLTGPEFSVSCENVAHDVIAALARRDAAMRNEGRRQAANEIREVLERLAKLGNGDRYGNSEGNLIARAALSDLATLEPEGGE